MELVEDKRLEKPNLCRVTTMVGSKEFICISEVHAEIYPRHTRPGYVHENNPNVDRHYFVRRYPYGNH